MTHSIHIPLELTTLNDYIDAERKNKQIAARIKKKHTNDILWVAKSKKFKVEEGKCYDVVFTWYKTDNMTDHDNISFSCKFILDGLKEAGSIKQDSPKFIWDISHKFELNKKLKHREVLVQFFEKGNVVMPCFSDFLHSELEKINIKLKVDGVESYIEFDYLSDTRQAMERILKYLNNKDKA